MTRIRRRLIVNTFVVGMAVTLLIGVLDWSSRLFGPLENWFYDLRATVCQRFTPAPTDQLAIVDIDDATLDAIGKWPWPRSTFAAVLDEIDRAGVKAIAPDMVFADPTDTRPGEPDEDGMMAQAMKRSGKVLIPQAMSRNAAPSPLFARAVELLTANLELRLEDCQIALGRQGLLPPGQHLDTDRFLLARRHAFRSRIWAELEKGPATLADLRHRLLPTTDASFTSSTRIRTLEEEFRKAQAVLQIQRFVLPLPPGASKLATFQGEVPPIARFGEAARASGFVEYLQGDEGGVVRSMPLLVGYRGGLFPQVALSLACMALDVDPKTLRIRDDAVVIPRPPGRDRDIVIPVRTRFSQTLGQKVGLIMDVPFRGTSNWENIFDHPRHESPALHIPMAYIWEAHAMTGRMASNNAVIDDALLAIMENTDPASAEKYNKARPPATDWPSRAQRVMATLSDLGASGLAELLNLPESEVKGRDDEETRKLKALRARLIDAATALSKCVRQNRRFAADIAERRANLKEKLAGRAVLVGWTATGARDSIATPIQPNCPGVIVHGLIFNAIMTGEFWRHAPAWVTFLITLAIGLIATLANCFLKPAWAIGVTVAVGVAYLLINGYLLFDYGNCCVGVAGPMTALGFAWATGAMAGFLIERTERTRITKRFSIMFDSRLVDYFVEHPEDALNGQVREMTVIFTDLQGFTTLSEKLRERTVPILSEYLGLMVPIIQRHEGVVNKFLGDGIMCFFNAPLDDPDHAANAVQTCLEMQIELDRFADTLVAQDLPRLRMRCGVSSGPMVVGASGPAQRCDYTVLGDTVNFASRLEGANKATGTRILISQRTAELVGPKYLLRPVGRLQVVGKSEGVMTYEPLALATTAGFDQRALVVACEKLVAAFTRQDFAGCIEQANRMDMEFGPSKLATLYRRICNEYLETPPADGFAGNLVLTEK